jgi:dUTP pyrophosphatase
MSKGASGWDLAACVEEPIRLLPGRWALVPTGIALEIPEGYEAQVRPRCGLAARRGIGILNAPGTIDSDYRGEVCVILMNWGSDDFVVNDGDRIAQLVFARVEAIDLRWTAEVKESDRGDGGFGHTGIGSETKGST